MNLSQNGYAIVPDVIARSVTASLIREIKVASIGDGDAREKAGRVYAVRNLMTAVPAVRDLASSTEIRSLVEAVLGSNAFPVRALLFDKTPGANWKVAWHQDLSIAVKERIDVEGFGPWSVKSGVQHVQPRIDVLENMITVRLHLDDCEMDNGPLLVLPGSHAAGALSPAEVEGWRKRVAPVACTMKAGSALLMRPLLLHASSSATTPRHRRVIHIEYANAELPGRLQWAEGSTPARSVSV